MLVLSLFPGIGLPEEGFTVVRGPDVLWGGDIRRFHPQAGKFDGVIGGRPSSYCRLVEDSLPALLAAAESVPKLRRVLEAAKAYSETPHSGSFEELRAAIADAEREGA